MVERFACIGFPQWAQAVARAAARAAVRSAVKAAIGMRKVIPDADVLKAQARRLVEHRITRSLLAKHKGEIARAAKRACLPRDLGARVEALVAERPELSWDAALDVILRGE